MPECGGAAVKEVALHAWARRGRRWARERWSMGAGCGVRVRRPAATVPATPKGQPSRGKGQWIDDHLTTGLSLLQAGLNQVVNTPCRVGSVQVRQVPTWPRRAEGEKPITQDR